MCKAKALWNHKHCLWFSLSKKTFRKIWNVFLFFEMLYYVVILFLEYFIMYLYYFWMIF